MKVDVFIDTVRHGAQFASDDDASRTVRAVLEGISHGMPEGDAEAIAADLPMEFADAIEEHASNEPNPIAYDDFLDHVAAEAECDRSEAQPRAQAVMAAVAKATSDFRFDNIHGHMPQSYGPIFEVGVVDVGWSLTGMVKEDLDMDEATAATAVRAVLGVLGERITRGEAQDLAAYFAAEEESWLLESATPDAEDFSYDEFVRRVADREGVRDRVARKHIEAVMSAIEGSAGREEAHDIMNQLPPEFSKAWS